MAATRAVTPFQLQRWAVTGAGQGRRSSCTHDGAVAACSGPPPSVRPGHVCRAGLGLGHWVLRHPWAKLEFSACKGSTPRPQETGSNGGSALPLALVLPESLEPQRSQGSPPNRSDRAPELGSDSHFPPLGATPRCLLEHLPSTKPCCQDHTGAQVEEQLGAHAGGRMGLHLPIKKTFILTFHF